MSNTLKIIKETVLNRSFRIAATHGIGFTAGEITSMNKGSGMDYYHPSNGDKHDGQLVHIGKDHYKVKDNKTKKVHTFKYFNKAEYDKAVGHKNVKAIQEGLRSRHQIGDDELYATSHSSSGTIFVHKRLKSKDELHKVQDLYPTVRLHVKSGKEIKKISKISHTTNVFDEYNMSNQLNIIKQVIAENYSSSAQVGMGLPKDEIKTKASFGLPSPIDYKHPKTGEVAHGLLHKVKARHYEVKDQKTGEIHKFRYWNRIGYERATGHTKNEEIVNEVLGPSATTSDYVHDFVHSDNPKFKGKSKKKRIQMAVAAYYSNKK